MDIVEDIISSCSLAGLDREVAIHEEMANLADGDLRIYFQGMTQTIRFARDLKEFMYLNYLPEPQLSDKQDNIAETKGKLVFKGGI